MSIQVVGNVDVNVLPNALLAAFKRHVRVENTYDDDFLTDALKRAIDQFQRVSGMTVNPTTFTWRPASGEFKNGMATSPITPVKAYTATGGTGTYSLTTNTVHGVPIYYLYGEYGDGLSLAIETGYASEAELPAGIRDVVFRLAATMYENREILVPSGQFLTPQWLEQVMGTYWLPRC